jgi:hypothetical protein
MASDEDYREALAAAKDLIGVVGSPGATFVLRENEHCFYADEA